MKKGILYITFGVISLLFVSCNKDKENSQITVQGKIVKDCAGTPYGNQQFTFINPGRALLDERQEVPFTTNADGSFEITCVPGPNSEPSEIRIGDDGGVPILQLDPIDDLNIGTINTTPTASYQINIKVNNPYQVGDTLIINDHKGNGKTYKFAAPLSDTALAIVYDYSNILQIPRLQDNNKVSVVSTTSVYSGTSGTSSFTAKFNKNNNLLFNGCTNNIQEAEVTID